MKIRIHRTGDALHTVASDEKGNEVTLYLPESAGGAATGIRPMQMLIMGMGGCAAVDVLTILKKQRQQVTGFSIDIEAEREPGKEPSLWQTAHLVFIFSGKVDRAKAEHAVQLSMQKYCSVSETLRRAGASLSWEVRITD
ncbi:MAG: OsmC family protein [Lewinellaceae bacterium]|nr:OsmC family protein [Lewinellaceae bacterium]